MVWVLPLIEDCCLAFLRWLFHWQSCIFIYVFVYLFCLYDDKIAWKKKNQILQNVFLVPNLNLQLCWLPEWSWVWSLAKSQPFDSADYLGGLVVVFSPLVLEVMGLITGQISAFPLGWLPWWSDGSILTFSVGRSWIWSLAKSQSFNSADYLGGLVVVFSPLVLEVLGLITGQISTFWFCWLPGWSGGSILTSSVGRFGIDHWLNLNLSTLLTTWVVWW